MVSNLPLWENLYFKGDLERTIPNIGSILNVEADILQLDVIRLFTSMEDEVWESFENTEKFSLKIWNWFLNFNYFLNHNLTK